MPKPSEDPLMPWAYDLFGDTVWDHAGEPAALIGHRGSYRLPSAVFEVETMPSGPWFVGILRDDGEHASILDALRMSRKKGSIPLVARHRALSDPSVTLWRSTSVRVPRAGRGVDSRDTRRVRLALSRLARADEDEQENALSAVLAVLSTLEIDRTESLKIELALLRFASADGARTLTGAAMLLA